jgi:hypothetical protein
MCHLTEVMSLIGTIKSLMTNLTSHMNHLTCSVSLPKRLFSSVISDMTSVITDIGEVKSLLIERMKLFGRLMSASREQNGLIADPRRDMTGRIRLARYPFRLISVLMRLVTERMRHMTEPMRHMTLPMCLITTPTTLLKSK